jgi:hypothetical protein
MNPFLSYKYPAVSARDVVHRFTLQNSRLSNIMCLSSSVEVQKEAFLSFSTKLIKINGEPYEIEFMNFVLMKIA